MNKSLFLVSLAALSLSACGYSVFDAAEDIKDSGGSEFKNGKPITSDAAITGAFTKLEALGPDNIVFTTGDSYQISATGDAETLKHLRYKVEDGTIMIGRDKNKWWGDSGKGVTITVTGPTLSKAALAGSGDFKADNMSGEKVVVEIAGSGNLSVVAITSKELESNIAGSGDVTLAGKVDRAEYSVAGSGSIDAIKLASTDADVSIAGSGDVSLTASGKVDASIAGSGNVTVAGGAKCSSSTMGSGSIKCS
jgi:hypothetical protein